MPSIVEFRERSAGAYLGYAGAKTGDGSNFEGDGSNFEGDRSIIEGDRDKNSRAVHRSAGAPAKS